jgi:type IV pilus assembly protein PilB
MHDLLKIYPEQDEQGNPLPTLFVGSYHVSAPEVVKELLSRSGLRGKVALKPLPVDFPNGDVASLVLMICTRIEDVTAARGVFTKMDPIQRSQLSFAIMVGAAVDCIPTANFSLGTDHIMKSPIAPSQFLRLVQGALAELQMRPSTRRVGFDRARQSLGEILVAKGIITPPDLEQALQMQKVSGKRLGECLMKLGMITDRERANFLAAQLDAHVANAQQFSNAETGIVALIPEALARRNQCVALELRGNELIVAMQDIQDLRLLDNLRDVTDKNIVPIIGTQDEIAQAIERYYRDITTEKDASSLMADLTSDDVEFVQNDDEDNTDIASSENASAELGIVRLVNMMIGNAVRDRASDIHIEPQEKSLIIRYRVDGDLRRIMTPPKKSHQAMITRIKILSNLDIAERRLPQDGRMAVKIAGREVDVRVSILPSVHGEKAVLRILDKDSFDTTVTNLGFSRSALAIFDRQIRKPYGMVIVTGPTGSGKSTTLYSAIQSVKDVTRNIITVEDPVEFHMDGVTQVPVNPRVGLTFASALRSILRQDPDIILIGEIRDSETADIAVKMALTGHMVYSSLHTNDAVSTITRLLDIGVPPLLLGSCLNLIIAQRLVRKICKHCRKEFTPAVEVLQQLKTKLPENSKFFHGEGCVHCHGSGFSGRLPLFEMLEVTSDVRRLIHKSSPVHEILAEARLGGMRSIFEMGIDRVLEGETTIEQVLAVAIES